MINIPEGKYIKDTTNEFIIRWGGVIYFWDGRIKGMVKYENLSAKEK